MAIPAEAEELVAGARLSAHLATAHGDRPHVAPVWYLYEDGVVSVLTGGTKLRNVRANPRVALSIERYDEDGVDWGVQLFGTARVVTDEGRAAAVAERIDEKYAGPYGTDGGPDERADPDDGDEETGDSGKGETRGDGDETENGNEAEDRDEAEKGGEDETGGADWALVEVEVGSASVQRY